MEWINDLPVFVIAVLIFAFRIIDVSMGTLRTLAIVEGKLFISMTLGFFEILVWIIAVSQVINRLSDSFFLPLAYAGGFAMGNAIGITLERYFAFGTTVIRIISAKAGLQIAETLRDRGQTLTTFIGDGRDGPVTLIIVSCPRKDQPAIISIARKIDPDIFFVSERANMTSSGRLNAFTGWRAVVKKK